MERPCHMDNVGCFLGLPQLVGIITYNRREGNVFGQNLCVSQWLSKVHIIISLFILWIMAGFQSIRPFSLSLQKQYTFIEHAGSVPHMIAR